MWVRRGWSFIVRDNVEIQGYLVWNRSFIFCYGLQTVTGIGLQIFDFFGVRCGMLLCTGHQLEGEVRIGYMGMEFEHRSAIIF